MQQVYRERMGGRMRRSKLGFYVTVEESLSGHSTLFYGFEGGQHDAITTKRGAVNFAKFLKQAANDIQRSANSVGRKV